MLGVNDKHKDNFKNQRWAIGHPLLLISGPLSKSRPKVWGTREDKYENRASSECQDDERWLFLTHIHLNLS